ncbi:MAG: glycosyl hydrolase family 38, partial [Bacteroidetes bacterium]|nr:glycosyl hydrolase family 38 [Bacteroidota bacterium]
MKKYLLIIASLFLTISWSFCQDNPIKEKDGLLQGFEKKISGTEFWYNSAIPSIHDAYLVRALDGKQSMEWHSEAVPRKIKNDTLAFVWLAGLGSNMGEVSMHLEIDGLDAGLFRTGMEKNWDVKLNNGAKLSFRTTYIDGANDLHGFMIARIPKNQLTPGKAVQFKVTGSASNSSAWYMTFLEQIPTELSINLYQALYREKGKMMQPVVFQIVYFGQPTEAIIQVNDKEVFKMDLEFGIRSIQLGIDPVQRDKKLKIALISKPLQQEEYIIQKPVKEWKVGFVQHSHTDIGYTRPQHEILAEHLRFIDYALDYCDATDHYPEESKFRWTCEASFAVDDYLRSRPSDQIERLKSRIAEGRIEVSGMYFNFDEMPDEYSLAASLEPLKRFKEAGIPVRSAMQNDVNGIAWCFADYFKDLGVKYLNMGTHGHRALIAFDKPTAFWWESPSGRRTLTFRAEHYMTGNTVFGIHSDNFEYFENKFLNYLSDLEAKDYPYDIIHIQHSGYQTDNAPPSTRASDMIRRWNEKYEWPKLRTATVSEFFVELEKNHAEDFPVYRAAWPDWWPDGFASGAREAATSRAAHADILAFEGALAMSNILGAEIPEGIHERLDNVRQALLFYDEHTFGHAQSVREPFGEGTMEQRALKESYAWEAYRRSRRIGEEAMGLLQAYISREKVPVIAVINTMNRPRSGVFKIYIDHQIIPMGAKFSLIDEAGKQHFAQALEHRSDGTYWSIFTSDVPGFGIKKLKVVTTPKAVTKKEILATHQSSIKETDSEISLQNKFYSLRFDKKLGAITELHDKEINKQLIDQEASWQLGEFIYERPENRQQMEAFVLNQFERFGLDSIWFENIEVGAVWTSLRCKGESEACIGPAGFELDIRIFHDKKRIDFVYMLRKKSVIEPEAVYIAFPFDLPDGKIFFDVPGGTVEAGIDQIPGSTTDWNTIQNFVSLRNDKAQIVLTSPEIPLMQLGGINTGRFQAGSTPENMHVYGWPMNNYWTTNFNADQRGEFTFSYSLTSGTDSSIEKANHFGWERRIPLLGRTLPSGTAQQAKKAWPTQNTLIQGIPENVLVVSARILEADKEMLLHLRELGNKSSQISIYLPECNNLQIQETDALGMPLIKGNSGQISPLETKFIKLKWN